MEDIQFCSFCGKIIEASFHYCPFCGTQMRDSLPFELMVDRALQAVEQVRMVDEMRRLEKLETLLQELENDLNVFLSVKSS